MIVAEERIEDGASDDSWIRELRWFACMLVVFTAGWFVGGVTHIFDTPPDLDRSIGASWLSQHGVKMAATDCASWNFENIDCTTRDDAGAFQTYNLTCAADGGCVLNSITPAAKAQP